MSRMWPSYVHQTDFNKSWSAHASRYSLWLYREAGWDSPHEVRLQVHIRPLADALSEPSCAAFPSSSSPAMLVHLVKHGQLHPLRHTSITRHETFGPTHSQLTSNL